MKLGILIDLKHEEGQNPKQQIESKFIQTHNMGFESCQLCCWDTSLMTADMAEHINGCCRRYNVEISAFWCGWSGPAVWNFYEGPLTLGLVPAEYRFRRMRELMHGSDFAKLLNVNKLATHAGFMPEFPETEQYRSVISALKQVALYCKSNGQHFLFETGQETPVTLRRAIEDIGTDNLGINLDPANLILYGKANPVDALDVFGEYVMDVHAKDGCYPTDGRNLGKETPLGEGKVNFPLLISKLNKLGYDGPLTIEREISGEKQIKDINRAKQLLTDILNNLPSSNLL